MSTFTRLRYLPVLLALLTAAATLWLATHGLRGRAASNDYVLSEKPLYIGGGAPPLMMLVASRDEQLFDKAYPDYTDLDEDGVVDVTYNNKFDYEGYFDPFLCYSYTGGVFAADGARTTDHKCGGSQWSGNFLNWLTMSRIDILRYVLYGGNRSVDSATETVLERAHIPTDMHAWAKTYSGSDIKDYVGAAITGTTATFCNASLGPAAAPLLRVASGRFPSWAVTEYTQCVGKGQAINADGDGDRPATTAIADFTVKVRVCDPSKSDAQRERFCSRYGSSYKPAGLLQEYGETGRLRFGLVSGTYSAPRAGGVLRKNIGLFAGNGSDATQCAKGDEVRLSDGTFCNMKDSDEGIINTLRRFKIVGWSGTGTDGAWDGSNWGTDCSAWGATNRTDIGSGILSDPGNGSVKCTPWGNPVSEMYAEAVRYLSGETSATASFTGGAGDIKGGRPTWVDPYGSTPKDGFGGGNPYCAACSIMVLSSGSSTYDGEVPTVARLGDTAQNATKLVGDAERITGKSFFVGSAADPTAANLAMSHTFFCKSSAVANLAYVRGICDDAPQREGSYLVAGLAKAAYAADLRSGNISGKPAESKVNVTTYTVALADGQPNISIPTAAGIVSLTPYCLANPNDSFKRTCQLGDTTAGKQVSTGGSLHEYGRDIAANAGSFTFSFDGSPQGESNDRDFVTMLTYCVGSACSEDTNPKNTAFKGYDICWGSESTACGTDGRPSVGANEVLVRTEILAVSSGNPVRVGYNISGSTDDGLYANVFRPGPPADVSAGATFNLLTGATPNGSKYPMDNPINTQWGKPAVVKFVPAGGASGALESPLWYAAKYGTDLTDRNGNGHPDWDDNGDGQPDNFLMARNPAKLKAELGKLIAKAAGASPVTGGGSSGARLSAGGSFSIASSFNLPGGTTDWTGNLVATETNLDGTIGAQRWSAATQLAGQAASGTRNIRVVMEPTAIGGSGAKRANAVVREFTESNLRSYDPAISVKTQLGLSASDSGWLGTVTDATLVDYLRGKANAAPLRVRGSMLGDIVNSSVEIVSAKDDFGYGAWSAQTGGAWKKTLGDSYKTYLAAKRAAAVNTALVGANDGLLHAFDVADGNERFAVATSSSRRRMGQLANPNYVHRYTMDGEIVGSDVPANAAGGWRALAVAASGAGGKSVVALDLSRPAAFDDSAVLWELSGTESGNAILNDLGYVFGRPAIVPIAGASAGGEPRWVALFGNGVNSAGGAPALFVVDVGSGEVLARLKPTDAAYATHNGLFHIAPVALYNGDGIVDTVYGGDLQGNVWKFDLSGASASSWKVAFSGKPLFSAKDAAGAAQPITGGLEVARGPGNGAVVLFGTGRYFTNTDNVVPSDPQVQSFYGVFDRCDGPDCSANIADGRAGLMGQTISEGTASGEGYRVRDISRNGSGRNGWYVDLRVTGKSATGERFIGTPRLQNGIVFFTAFEPVGGDCRAGGRNWLYGLDLMSGAGAMSGVSATPGGASVCSGNCAGITSEATGAPVKDTDVLLPPPPAGNIVSCGANDPNCTNPDGLQAALAAKQCSLVLRSEGTKPLYMPRPCGRQSWRQIR